MEECSQSFGRAMIQEGTRVRVKPDAWAREWPRRDYPISPIQIVVNIGSHPPFEGLYMLSWPLHWWNEEDLEIVPWGPRDKVLEIFEQMSVEERRKWFNAIKERWCIHCGKDFHGPLCGRIGDST